MTNSVVRRLAVGICILCLIALSVQALAQSPASLESPQQAPRPFILRQLVNDMAYLSQQPDFYAVVGAVGLTPVMFKSSFDTEEPEFTEALGSSHVADMTFEAGEVIGNAIYPASASAALWAFGRYKHHTFLEDFGSDLLRAQFINGIATLSLKAAINRRRPNGGSYSYPSGHTTTVFTVAGVVYRDCGAKWGIPAFAVATYVGLSRLQEGKHYTSDVVAGAILGGYLGLKIAGRSNREHEIQLQPAVSRKDSGIIVMMRF